MKDTLPSFAAAISNGTEFIGFVRYNGIDVRMSQIGVIIEVDKCVIGFNPITPRMLKSTRPDCIPHKIRDIFYTHFNGMSIPQTPGLLSGRFLPLSFSSGWVSLDTMLLEASQKMGKRREALEKEMSDIGLNIEHTQCFLSTRTGLPEEGEAFERLLIDSSQKDSPVFVWIGFNTSQISVVHDLTEKLDYYLSSIVSPKHTIPFPVFSSQAF